MSSEAWRKSMEDKCMSRKREENTPTYKVLNKRSNYVYITTKCKVVADGCFRRNRDKQGPDVIMEISQ